MTLLSVPSLLFSPFLTLPFPSLFAFPSLFVFFPSIYQEKQLKLKPWSKMDDAALASTVGEVMAVLEPLVESVAAAAAAKASE